MFSWKSKVGLNSFNFLQEFIKIIIILKAFENLLNENNLPQELIQTITTEKEFEKLLNENTSCGGKC